MLKQQSKHVRFIARKAFVSTIRLFLCLCLLVSLSVPTAVAQTVSHRPRIGVVLGGGGAKGAAHIGVLKYIEEQGIPIDCVTGTSMGSIIGGLYAMGYSPEEMATLIANVDWSQLMLNRIDPTTLSSKELSLYRDYLIRIPFNLNQKEKTIVTSRSLLRTIISSLPSSFMGGSNVSNLFNSLSLGYNDSLSFDSLPIPFACVATDIVSGEPYVMRSGVLPTAMRASMAIPGVFDPVRIGDRLLLDGGMVNNFPTDICVDSLGADIVIGIEVAQELDSSLSNLSSLPQIANQLMQIAVSKNKYDNRQKCEIYIRPDVSGYNMLSFSPAAIDTLVRRGYEQAALHAEEFAELRRQLDIYGAHEKELHARPAEALGLDTIYITDITLNGISKSELMQDRGKYRWLLRRSGISEGPITGPQLEHALSMVKGTGAFSDIVYNLHNAQCPTDSIGLSCYKLSADLKEAEPHVFALGLRYDLEESAALYFKIGLNQRRIAGAKLQLYTKLNYNPRFTLTASYEGLNFATLNLEYDYRSDIYNFLYHYDYAVYGEPDYGKAVTLCPFASKYNYLRLYLSEFQSRMFSLRLGVQEESIYFYRLETSSVFARSFGSFVSVDVDTRNRSHLAEQGTVFSFMGDIHRFHDDEFRPYQDVFFSGCLAFSTILPIDSRFSIIPQLYARANSVVDYAFEDDVDDDYDNKVDLWFYATMFGGMIHQRYSLAHLPFVGVVTPQQSNRIHDAAVARIDFRVRLFENSYLSLMGNVIGGCSEPILNFDRSGKNVYSAYYGLGLQYAVPTIIGPLTASVQWSNITNKFVGYLSLGYDF